MTPLPGGKFADRLQQPEYTGENRCLPCTVTNLVIGTVVSLLVGYVTFAADAGIAVANGLAGGTFLMSVALIYFRGYLVPGTPTFTKRYFPEWLLDLFGKVDDHADKHEPIDTDVDVEAVLLEAHVIEPKPNGDLGLTAEFEAELFDQIAAEQQNDTDREALASIVGIDPDTLEFDNYGNGAFVAFSGRDRVGNWESRAAFIADTAAGRLLPDRYEDWEQTSAAARGAILAGLRLFLERCPTCDGPVRFGQEVVESCCRTHDVVAVTCEECDARLFEVQVTEEMLADDPEPVA